MKNALIILVISIIIPFKCHSQWDLNYIFFMPFCHYSGSDCIIGTVAFEQYYMEPVDIDFLFDASFTSSCNYTSNNSGWNKLYRVEKLAAHKDRSLRLGWRMNQEEEVFEIGLYAHIYGEVESINLEFTPDFNQYNTYYLRMRHNGMYARAGNNSYCIKRKVFDKDLHYFMGVARGAYFGGDEGAPKFMDMWAKNESWNINSDFWDNGPNKGFGESIFYTDESFTVTAENSITAPLMNTNNSSHYTTIENGSDVSFCAGNLIRLKSGFHARAGSYFHAYISADKTSWDTISNLFLTQEAKSNEFRVGNTTSVSDTEMSNNFDQENKIAILPNPNNGHFSINISKSINNLTTISVFNSFGTLIYKNENCADKIIDCDISSFPKGLYIVNILSGKDLYIKKLIYR